MIEIRPSPRLLKKIYLLPFLLFINSCIHYGKIEQGYNTGFSLSDEPQPNILFTGLNALASNDSKSLLQLTRQHFGKCDIQVIDLHSPLLNEDFLKAGFPTPNRDIDDDTFMNRMKMTYGITHLFLIRTYDPEIDWPLQIRDLEYKSAIFLEIYSLAKEKVVVKQLLTSRTIRSPYPILGSKSPYKGTIYTSYVNGLRKFTKPCR